jgi:YesN/AraC family two-component response regulator
VNYTLKGNVKSTEYFFDSVILDTIKDSSYGQLKGLYRYLADLRDIILQSKNTNFDRVFDDDIVDITGIYNPRLLHETIKNMYLEIAEFCIQQNTSLFEKAVKYINSNYMKDLSLIAIADDLEVTAVYLSSYFKKVSGTNVITYLNKIRIEVALDIMKNNRKMKLNEISEKVGFPNADTFTRQFKKIIGITPNKYWELL